MKILVILRQYVFSQKYWNPHFLIYVKEAFLSPICWWLLLFRCNKKVWIEKCILFLEVDSTGTTDVSKVVIPLVSLRDSLQQVTNGVRIANSKQNELSIINYLLSKIAFYEVLTGGGKVRNFSITSGSTSTIVWINNMDESNYIW